MNIPKFDGNCSSLLRVQENRSHPISFNIIRANF
jgi:hypothetical protein